MNYTLTSEEIGTQMIEKLANRTLRVVTTPVCTTEDTQYLDPLFTHSFFHGKKFVKI